MTVVVPKPWDNPPPSATKEPVTVVVPKPWEHPPPSVTKDPGTIVVPKSWEHPPPSATEDPGTIVVPLPPREPRYTPPEPALPPNPPYPFPRAEDPRSEKEGSPGYRLFISVCKRPQWLPMAIVLTICVVLYASMSDDAWWDANPTPFSSSIEGFTGTSPTPQGRRASGVGKAARRLSVLCAASPSGGARYREIDEAVEELRSQIDAAYGRHADVKVALGAVALVVL